ncbi:MAG: DNA repair protein RadA, partial [Lachnospiraceae bacterium]|nr:DNA repair protein RadA [Lachnospiraceae bacterium]
MATAKGKIKTVFFCNECGFESPKWVGQCPACKAWNTMTEERINASASVAKTVKEALQGETVIAKIDEITLEKDDYVPTGMQEFDRVLGGGIVPGSLTLVGGDPGIGKSTLLLQICRLMGQKGHSILYISGEESLKQIKIRALRLGEFNDKVELMCETSLTVIEEVIRRKKPEIVVIDSIQTMFLEEVTSAPGSVSQVKESTGVFMRLAKGLNVSILIVGHVTKEGTVAGPRVLEHMVDTVLYFEGDRHGAYRILRGVKNRFGSTNEIGVFEMTNDGLLEVESPSAFLLEGRDVENSGSSVICTMEGSRGVLAEIQALVAPCGFGNPRRMSAGIDLNRVILMIAVLEKRAKVSLSNSDVYVNVAGGLKIFETASDLGLCVAIWAAKYDKKIPENMIFIGEVGLGGELRNISRLEKRIFEAAKLGF